MRLCLCIVCQALYEYNEHAILFLSTVMSCIHSSDDCCCFLPKMRFNFLVCVICCMYIIMIVVLLIQDWERCACSLKRRFTHAQTRYALSTLHVASSHSSASPPTQWALATRTALSPVFHCPYQLTKTNKRWPLRDRYRGRRGIFAISGDA